MTKAIFTYLNHRIEIELPHPEEDNTVLCTIYRLPGTYDAVLYNDYVDNYQFSAVGDDPNQWVLEAISHAIKQLEFSGLEYHTAPPVRAKEWAELSNKPDIFTEF